MVAKKDCQPVKITKKKTISLGELNKEDRKDLKLLSL